MCELTDLVDADQSTVSKHLAILKQAGIIEDQKDGPRTSYHARIRCLEGLWDYVENVLPKNLRAQPAAMGG